MDARGASSSPTLSWAPLFTVSTPRGRSALAAGVGLDAIDVESDRRGDARRAPRGRGGPLLGGGAGGGGGGGGGGAGGPRAPRGARGRPARGAAGAVGGRAG